MAEELTQINIPNVPVTHKERLEREAKRQDRALASLLRKVIAEYVALLDESPRPATARQREALDAPQTNGQSIPHPEAVAA